MSSIASLYVDTPLDKDGNLFQAGKTYSLTAPKEVPVTQFWSLTVYDILFRFYGPEEAFFNKTFKLADVELVK